MTSVLLLLLLSGRSRFITTCVSSVASHHRYRILLLSSSPPVIERRRSRWFGPRGPYFSPRDALKPIFKRYADAPTRCGNATDSGVRLLEPWDSRHGWRGGVTKRKFADSVNIRFSFCAPFVTVPYFRAWFMSS